MVFASGLFIFLFLPITIIGYSFLKEKSVILQNLFLLFMSFFFYLKNGIDQFALLCLSIIINYFIARMIVSINKRKLVILWIGIIYNIGILFIYKYLSFFLLQIGYLRKYADIFQITLPLGISFYTFQAVSYIIDVYRDDSLVERNLINVALYICFFPQLIAGPIVRWNTIKNNLVYRNEKVNYGIERFVIGLAKKVLIANTMALYADKAFELLNRNELTTGMAWMGAITYTLQIYYDFSGYSDMAIGLGNLFGFEFPENFNYPYISSSVTEFWRRWHISLSSWFRDYLYIPLGGNRCNKYRNIINLFIVWACTGIWHGANYTFWIWGLAYFVILVIEKYVFSMIKANKVTKCIGHIYTLTIVVLLWVIFRSDSLVGALEYIKIMFNNAKCSEYSVGVTKLFFSNNIIFIIIAILGCIPWYEKAKSIEKMNAIHQIYLIFLFVISICVTIDSTYNPFIYFNF